MALEELKKKILSIVRGAMIEADELPFIETTDNIADALVAAGIGDVSELQKECDSKEETYNKCYLDFKHWKDKAKEFEHRAEIAEAENAELRAGLDRLEKAGEILQRDLLRVFSTNNERTNELLANIWETAKLQAEKELEERLLKEFIKEQCGIDEEDDKKCEK